MGYSLDSYEIEEIILSAKASISKLCFIDSKDMFRWSDRTPKRSEDIELWDTTHKYQGQRVYRTLGSISFCSEMDDVIRLLSEPSNSHFGYQMKFLYGKDFTDSEALFSCERPSQNIVRDNVTENLSIKKAAFASMRQDYCVVDYSTMMEQSWIRANREVYMKVFQSLDNILDSEDHDLISLKNMVRRSGGRPSNETHFEPIGIMVEQMSAKMIRVQVSASILEDAHCENTKARTKLLQFSEFILHQIEELMLSDKLRRTYVSKDALDKSLCVQGTHCSCCHKKFGMLFSRRQHCKTCSQEVCGDCCHYIKMLAKDSTFKFIKICSLCKSYKLQRKRVNHLTGMNLVGTLQQL